MADNTLKEFLVKLGYKIDSGSEKKFTDSVAGATVKVVELGTAITATSTAVIAGVAKISDGLERLYYTSKRVGGTAENLQAFGQAASLFGTSAEDAIASAVSLGDKLRNMPNMAGKLEQLGVASRDMNGNMRDTSEIMADLGEALNRVPQYQSNAIAGLFGIDQNTLLAMQRGDIRKAMNDRKAMYAGLGLDVNKAAAASTGFMNSLRGLSAFILALGQKVASLLQEKFGTNIEKLTKKFQENGPRIAAALAEVLGLVVKISEKLGSMVGTAIDIISDLVDWFDKLSPGAKLAAEAIVALAIAFKVLQSVSIVGLLLALGTALIAVYDDYKQWKEEGKEGFIDWDKWEPVIQEAIAGIKLFLKIVGDVLQTIYDTAVKIWNGIVDAFENNTGYLRTIIFALAFLPKELIKHWDLVEDFFVGMWEGIKSSFSVAWDLISPILDKLKIAINWISGTWLGKKLAGIGSSVASGLDAEFGYGGNNGAPAPTMSPKQIKTTPVNQLPTNILSSAGGSLQDRAMQIMQGFGWAKHQAAGIVANLMRESTLDPNAVGDSGAARGLAQWHPPRQAAFARFMGKDIANSTMEEQLAFLNYELRSGTERGAGRRLAMAQNAAQAGDVVSRYYERPGDIEGEAAKRSAAAARLEGMTQTNTITINGATDPKATGREVKLAMNSVNENLFRNTKGAVVQ